MRGMMHVPSGADETHRVPVVLILHGFAGNRIGTGFSNAELSKRLAAEGIASVRFDFLGSGESDGRFQDMSVLTELQDAESILDFARRQPFADPGRIAVHGMSQGGLVAALLAGSHPEELVCESLWSPAFSIGDKWKRGIAEDLDPDVLQRDGYVDAGGLRLGEIYYRDAVNTDFYGIAAGFKGDVSIVHGTKDKVVPIAFSRKLKQVLGDRAVLTEIEGAGHDYEKIAYAEARQDLAVRFLKKELLGKE
jgi:pimeloyl-ACP methyl ester carboxylesterase